MAKIIGTTNNKALTAYILLAEDDPVNRELMIELLESIGSIGFEVELLQMVKNC